LDQLFDPASWISTQKNWKRLKIGGKIGLESRESLNRWANWVKERVAIPLYLPDHLPQGVGFPVEAMTLVAKRAVAGLRFRGGLGINYIAVKEPPYLFPDEQPGEHMVIRGKRAKRHHSKGGVPGWSRDRYEVIWQEGEIFISIYSTRLGMDELLRLANSSWTRVN
jgi:hypothetical protein